MASPSPPSTGPSTGPPSSNTTPITVYPEEAWFTLTVFLALVGLFQWGSVVYSKVARQRRLRKGTDVESTHSSSHGRVVGGGWSLARLPLAAVNTFRVVAFRWTLEFGTYDLKLADIVLTLAYVAFLLTWTFVGDQDLEVTQLTVREWSNRAGLVAASQLPLVTILGTKHNVVSLITGVGYEKLNFFHRVTARSCFGLLLIHASGKIYSGQSFLSILVLKTWFRLGILALTSLTILSIVSLRVIRNKAYEIFFYTHFIAVLIFLVGAYYHTGYTHTSYWIWPSFMFWALDRLLRFARVVVFNHLYCSFTRRGSLQDASTELLSDEFVRVRAHPFSISSIDSDLFRPGADNEHYARDSDTAYWKELVFLINVRNGFTKRLKEAAMQGQTVKLLIDGPYGSAPDVCGYETSILIAGGSGVTHTLPLFLDLIENARKGASHCRRVVFIWAVRDANHVRWISEALYQAHALIPAWLTVSIRIFTTRNGAVGAGGEVLQILSGFSESHSVDSEAGAKKEGEQGSPKHGWIVPPSVRMEQGRPDFKSILRGEVSTATGSLSVTVCGSQGLTRSVRRALRFPVSSPYSVLRGGPSVTLHVESFGYA